MKNRKYFLKLLRNTCFVFFLAGANTLFCNGASHPSPEILFISNINGNLENCNCGSPPLGGLNYLATILAEIRTSNKDVLLIDGGDFCNTYPFAELNESIVRAYQYMKPDIIVPADQEMISGADFFHRILNLFKKNVLLSNLHYNKSALNPLETCVFSNGQKVQVLSYIAPNAINNIPANPAIRIDERQFESSYRKLNSASIRILVFHGLFAQVKTLLAKYPNIDIILLAHEQGQPEILNKDPLIIGGGADGEFLVKIKLGMPGDKKVTVTKIAVSKQNASDPTVDEIIAEYRQAIGRKEGE